MKDGALRRLCSVSSFLCHKQNSARLFVLKHIILINRGNHTTLRASRLQGDAPNKYGCGNCAEKTPTQTQLLQSKSSKVQSYKSGSLWVHEMFNCSILLNTLCLEHFYATEMHCCTVLRRTTLQFYSCMNVLFGSFGTVWDELTWDVLKALQEKNYINVLNKSIILSLSKS